ncbi:hypothetical protein IGI04_042561 [Brassica rapa subsp. trilocularis]|uniref:Ubiquitin-like protease family profile domain-containing protein n=1 Tax=Brassica rapa subsp. trilocularis TaxID=1813537 RepID=A0ABQ7KI09_BRACM|nr:hypothetical protein IGI04_042561 [Brassica rapa subsp. trilocularis]
MFKEEGTSKFHSRKNLHSLKSSPFSLKFPVFQAASPEKAVRPLVNLSCVQLESQSTSEFNPRCLLQDDKGETTILAVHSKDTPTTTYTPKQLKWDEITIPDQWKIEITQPPRNFEQKNISKIIEQKDGKILLRFGSYRDPLPPRISSYHSRASFSEYRTGQSSTNSETESVNQNTKQDEPIRFKAPIAEPDQDAYPTSPTPSDFRSINVITKKYEIDKQYIREDFYSKENEEKRTSDYIKNQPHLQGRTLTPNPYSALAEYPPLSYSKAVSEKSSKMEAQSSTATPNTTSNTTPNTKPVYYTKPYKQHLMTTPYTKTVNLTQLKTFINRVFYEDSPWPTDNITKNQSFYEYILVDSKSIEITHYKDKTNPNLINYSTCKFLRICSTQDLGFIHHHTTKPFSTPGYHIDGYTYTDYKNAFFRAFLLRPYDHSWFFSFDQNCTKTIPGWFNEWWYWYGPADPIYPDQVLKTSYPFYKKHVFDQPVGPLNKIWFHIDMSIPWICSWHFTLAIALQDMPYSLLREFRVKWWEKYNLDRCSLAGIQKYFQITNQAKTAIQTISKSIPLLNPTQISQTNPSPQKRPTSSPTSSTTSSSSQKSSRKEKMKKLIAEMLTQFEAEHDDTDDDNQQVDIMQPEDPYGGPLGQDPVYLYNKTRGKAMQEFRERIQPTMAGPTWDPHEDFCTKQQQFLTAIVGTTQDSTRIKSSVGTTRRRHQSTSEFNPRCLLQDDKGETTILAVHSKDTPTTTYTPKQLKWDEITIPDQWEIEITQPPRNLEQKNISKIIEQKDGKILLRFGSYRDPLPPRISLYHSRASFSEYRTGQSSTNSETESVNQNTKQDELIRFKAPIAEPDQDAYPTSPTPSDFRSINVITKKYEIDKQYIREDFYSKENEEKRTSDYIKNQPHLQGRTLTPNPYSALAEYPPLSYSKAVSEKSSKMEAQSSTATPNTTSNTTPNTKPVYYTKPYKQHLMTTPYTKTVNLTQLKTFINRVFYEDSPWPTDNITKNQSFYEYILVDSKSIEITHYKDKTNPNLINYSTCKFLRICSTQDLGFIHHHTTKPFSTPGYHIDGYTYTDYKNAFFQAFLLRPYDHSWFFSFDQNCTKTIPGWFNEWWYWYGPADPIYPDQVLKTSYPFYKKHVFDQPVGPLNKIWFHIDMSIPWICSWHFTLAIALQDMPYSLLREFRVKWWEKYNLDRCSLAGIQKYFQITNQAKTAIQTISKSIPLLNPTQISQTNPSPQKRPTSSPTSSTTSSSSQKSSRKEKMKKLIAEMLTQFEAEHDDTDDDNQQVDIMQPEDPYGGPLGQDPVYLYNKTRGKAMQEFRERIQPTMAGPTWDPHEDFCTKQQQFLTAIVGTTQDSTRIKSSVGTTRRRHVARLYSSTLCL